MASTGFLLIDKPAGITSHDVIARLRRLTGIKKIGHGGTLDPFATGLLIVGVGREATRELGLFIGKDKEYEATMRLGATSDSQDKDGTITETPNAALPTEAKLSTTLDKFVGIIQQVPPMFSAKKVGGKKLYELARRGEVIERQPVEINIYSLNLLSFDPPFAKFQTHCGSGTYVRTLAHDIGQTLGCGAYLTELRRTKIGDFDIKNATKLEDLNTTLISDLLSSMPRPNSSS